MKKLILALCIISTTPTAAQQRTTDGQPHIATQPHMAAQQRAYSQQAGQPIATQPHAIEATADTTHCQAITKAGRQCLRRATTAEGYCSQHNPYADKCQGTTKAGKPCQLAPKHGEAYCHNHKTQGI